MEKITLTLKDFNHLRRLECSNHSESSLYIKEKTVYKILRSYLRNERKFLIPDIQAMHLDGAIPFDKLIYDGLGFFLGYTMPYLDGYKEISSKDLVLTDIEKIKIIERIEQIYRGFLKRGICYVDLHGKNIMTDKQDAVFIDMDSVMYTKNCSDISRKASMDRLVWKMLTLSLGFDVYHILGNYLYDDIVSKARVQDTYLFELLKFIFLGEVSDFANVAVAESIENMDKEKVRKIVRQFESL